MKFDSIIKKIYYDPGGYGSMQDTFKEVKKVDSSIQFSDVKDWFERSVQRKKNLRGFNSYVSLGPRDEFEVDLFDVNYLGQDEFRYGFLAIDNFTKVMWVIPIKNKSKEELIRATEAIIKDMGETPKRFIATLRGG